MTERNREDRAADWSQALASGTLPSSVVSRLRETGKGQAPWTSTMTPAELLTARRHGIQPIATVSGTCWLCCGRSWTEGHAEGWRLAVSRMEMEAVAAGANAIVDVKLRTIQPVGETDGLAASGVQASMDFTVVGTAIRVADLPPSPAPIVATVSTLAFIRLLEAGVVPVGIAVGAQYEWLTPSRQAILSGGYATTMNACWSELGSFWERIRNNAIRALEADGARTGNGILAHTHFGQIIKSEPTAGQPTPQYLGRWIVIGTVVEASAQINIPFSIHPVLDVGGDGVVRGRVDTLGDVAFGLASEKDGAI